ncbi:hypothetical protein KC340_g17441 [Hortaea werneckii]|nr:hypothetical protein KC342_g17678 [Hortaea werneckii]KAI7057538.1 hypothetical protein KC339_g17889 [Hortaea werneckii]KAI7207067.1 hypothetical protein KC365_g16767 [Hortaea werneckii]KAI7290311.1 hypothetical protein KC340_g17441 [Hortaea werneckii]KAI7372954.1 hypothetical protein KC328_g16920 [Hortaea werneckii]
MPLCCIFTRFAARSYNSPIRPRPPPLPLWPLLSRTGRGLSTAVAERALPDDGEGFAESGRSSFNDAVQPGNADVRLKRKSDSASFAHDPASTQSLGGQNHTRKDSKTSSPARLAARKTRQAGHKNAVGHQRGRTGVFDPEHVRREQQREPVPSDPRSRALYRTRIGALNRKASPYALQSVRSDLRNSAVYSSVWNTRFQQLALPFDKKLRESFQPHVLEFDTRLPQWVDELEQERLNGDGKVDMETFARKRGMIGRQPWCDMALWILAHRMDYMFDFLRATNKPIYPPINWVEDVLTLMARHYDSVEDGSRHSWLRTLATTFFELVPRETNEQWIFRQDFVKHVVPHFSQSQMGDIFQMVKTEKVKLTPNTLLHVADSFAKRDMLEKALSMLLEAKEAGARVNGIPFRTLCSTILRRSSAQSGGLRICLRLIEHLVAMGVKLNLTLCNIVMLNAVEAGDIETADSVHRSALEQGLGMDVYTCAIRLKACKLDIQNAERLKQTIEEAIAVGDIRTNEIVATEVLHCLTLQSLTAPDGWQNAFSKIATACVELFDIEPMKRLGLDMPEPPPNTSATRRLAPTRHVFTYLLLALLRRGATTEKSIELYQRWRQLVEAGDKPLAACATTAHVSNVFLRRFVRRRDTLLQAAQVVKDMQKPLPTTAGVVQAPPNIYTWSIFLHGFASHGQTKLAEQVLTYMRERGIEPNEVTWTSLVGGYARTQDTNGLLDSLRRMQADGAVFNDWTQGSLRRFRDRDRLRQILDQQRLQRSLDFTGDLKEGLGWRFGESEPTSSTTTTTEARALSDGDADAEVGGLGQDGRDFSTSGEKTM